MPVTCHEGCAARPRRPRPLSAGRPECGDFNLHLHGWIDELADHRRVGRTDVAAIAPDHFRDRRKIRPVRDKNADPHHVGEGGTGLLQSGPDVAETGFRLRRPHPPKSSCSYSRNRWFRKQTPKARPPPHGHSRPDPRNWSRKTHVVGPSPPPAQVPDASPGARFCHRPHQDGPPGNPYAVLADCPLDPGLGRREVEDKVPQRAEWTVIWLQFTASHPWKHYGSERVKLFEMLSGVRSEFNVIKIYNCVIQTHRARRNGR